jgi:hypothetical protein
VVFCIFLAEFDQHELTAVNYISIMPYTLKVVIPKEEKPNNSITIDVE